MISGLGGIDLNPTPIDATPSMTVTSATIPTCFQAQQGRISRSAQALHFFLEVPRSSLSCAQLFGLSAHTPLAGRQLLRQLLNTLRALQILNMTLQFHRECLS